MAFFKNDSDPNSCERCRARRQRQCFHCGDWYCRDCWSSGLVCPQCQREDQSAKNAQKFKEDW